MEFNEFLSETKPIKDLEKKLEFEAKKLDSPKAWKGEQIEMKTLGLTENQAAIVGKLYYTALFMGHWDLFNNINLTNAGTVVINGKEIPTIVDWGNCLGVGFGGVDQDSTSFNNPEIRRATEDNVIEGFTGSLPFDATVYPKLPRQVVKDLFDLDPTSNDPLRKAMLKGFYDQHAIATQNENKITYIVENAFDSVSKTDANYAKSIPTNTKKELSEILKGRLHSLSDIVAQLKTGKSMTKIAEIQREKILTGQYPEKRWTSEEREKHQKDADMYLKEQSKLTEAEKKPLQDKVLSQAESPDKA